MTRGLSWATRCHAKTLSLPSGQVKGPALPSAPICSCTEHSSTSGGVDAGARTIRPVDEVDVAVAGETLAACPDEMGVERVRANTRSAAAPASAARVASAAARTKRFQGGVFDDLPALVGRVAPEVAGLCSVGGPAMVCTGAGSCERLTGLVLTDGGLGAPSAHPGIVQPSLSL